MIEVKGPGVVAAATTFARLPWHNTQSATLIVVGLKAMQVDHAVAAFCMDFPWPLFLINSDKYVVVLIAT